MPVITAVTSSPIIAAVLFSVPASGEGESSLVFSLSFFLRERSEAASSRAVLRVRGVKRGAP